MRYLLPSQVTEERLIEAAASLRRARATATPVAPLRDGLATLEDAYRVQGINTAVSLSQGRRLVGRKIGLTSHAVQHQLGVEQPDYGMLYADMEVLDAGVVDVHSERPAWLRAAWMDDALARVYER